MCPEREDPRDAAVRYRGAMWEAIRKATEGADPGDAAVAASLGQAVDAVVHGLLYVGDQVGAASGSVMGTETVPTGDATLQVIMERLSPLGDRYTVAQSRVLSEVLNVVVDVLREATSVPESVEVRAVTPCTLVAAGQRHALQAGDSLSIPTGVRLT